MLFVLAVVCPLIQDLWSCCSELHSAPSRAVGVDKLGLQIAEGNKGILEEAEKPGLSMP